MKWDTQGLATSGSDQSNQAVPDGGSTFQLWTIKQATGDTPKKDYLLGHAYVASVIARVKIRTGDPDAPVPRTRAGEPFEVEVTVEGLKTPQGEAVGIPEAEKKISFLHHVQAYGPDGNSSTIDRSQRTLKEQHAIEANGLHTFSYLFSSVPGSDLTKLRGEETFSAHSLQHGNTPAFQIDSAYVEIWPVATGRINGIEEGDVIRYAFPQINVEFEDIYPSGGVSAQVYKGAYVPKKEGIAIPGAAKPNTHLIPWSDQLPVKLDDFVDENGTWTLVLIDESPFGKRELHHVPFEVDRTIKVNSSITTNE